MKLPNESDPDFLGSMRRAAAELQQQWRTFDTALSHTPDFTYTFDLDGRFTYVNRALLTLWDKPLAEAVGKNFFELDYPPDLAARLQRQIQEVIQTAKPVRDSTPYTGAKGESGYYEYIFVPVFGVTGQVEAVTGSTRDITEHVRMKEALAASEQRLQQVFSQAPVGIVVFRGRDFVVELINQHYQAMIPGREVLGRPFAEVMPELASEVWDVFNRVLDTGEPFIANEWLVPYYNSNGTLEDHFFNVLYHPLREPDGSISGFVAVLTDVTAQVTARKEVERINRQLEEFAYVASHDLQEPLRMVNIYTQLLVRRFAGEDPEAQQYASTISSGVQRMEALIRDLLTYSSAIQKDETPAGSADLNESLADAVGVLKARIEETSARITAVPLPSVIGNVAQLSNLFQNLLSNAIKYSKKDCPPDIQISAEHKDAQWIVSVRDNGIGFEPEHADRIFGLFKRLHKDEYPGTGLGLAICQRIVNRYGGRMWAESALGAGSTFYFSLPEAEVQ
jgi:PAS domain S-box-containing protein